MDLMTMVKLQSITGCILITHLLILKRSTILVIIARRVHSVQVQIFYSCKSTNRARTPSFTLSLTRFLLPYFQSARRED